MKLFTLCLGLLAIALRVHSQTTVRRLAIGDCPRPTASDIETLIPLSFDLADGAPLPVIKANVQSNDGVRVTWPVEKHNMQLLCVSPV